MATVAGFTVQQQERYFALRERGEISKIAAEKAGVHPKTISRWVKEGHAEDATEEKKQFARRYESLRFIPEDITNLTPDDLVVMLEAKARNGSVTAIIALLNRPWEQAKDEPEKKETTFADELSARRLNKQAETS